ncbi:uncharacterized protein DSM5745_04282 [Aspergillus mulundensis]|uniref:Uncharacterized protein n=1 Tax=Aspergillus mulundensis TaxID=1810919 RepID=A0A3D8SCA4_9EURO|nr:hypothetical protein DSM5745_04282 [Aspergillus mulundensis]RDW83956.1 hypothetical protein DSM5745_04282 [Aspergillus mulundensis]
MAEKTIKNFGTFKNTADYRHTWNEMLQRITTVMNNQKQVKTSRETMKSKWQESDVEFSKLNDSQGFAKLGGQFARAVPNYQAAMDLIVSAQYDRYSDPTRGHALRLEPGQVDFGGAIEKARLNPRPAPPTTAQLAVYKVKRGPDHLLMVMPDAEFAQISGHACKTGRMDTVPPIPQGLIVETVDEENADDQVVPQPAPQPAPEPQPKPQPQPAPEPEPEPEPQPEKQKKAKRGKAVKPTPATVSGPAAIVPAGPATSATALTPDAEQVVGILTELGEQNAREKITSVLDGKPVELNTVFAWTNQKRSTQHYTLMQLAVIEIRHLRRRHAAFYEDGGSQYSLLQQILDCDPLLYLIQTVIKGTREIFAIRQDAKIVQTGVAVAGLKKTVGNGGTLVQFTIGDGIGLVFQPTPATEHEMRQLDLFETGQDCIKDLMITRSLGEPVTLDIQTMHKQGNDQLSNPGTSFVSADTPIALASIGFKSYTDVAVKAELEALFGSSVQEATRFIQHWRTMVSHKLRYHYHIWKRTADCDEFDRSVF